MTRRGLHPEGVLQEFFLDKYMVATAFGLALAFMLRDGTALPDMRTRRLRRSWCSPSLERFSFHSLVGFVMLAGIFGSAILAWLSAAAMPFRTQHAGLLGVSMVSFWP
jgi:hypothetical protein